MTHKEQPGSVERRILFHRGLVDKTAAYQERCLFDDELLQPDDVLVTEVMRQHSAQNNVAI